MKIDFTFYSRAPKLVACVVLVQYLKQETRQKLRYFCKAFGISTINELVLPSNKLTNNFVGLVTSGLEPDMALGPPV
jgi:hypothetical protein